MGGSVRRPSPLQRAGASLVLDQLTLPGQVKKCPLYNLKGNYKELCRVYYSVHPYSLSMAFCQASMVDGSGFHFSSQFNILRLYVWNAISAD
jgi:hypothetical protein